MVEKVSRETIAQHAELHDAIPATQHQVVVNRTFELPRALYGLTVGCYFGFLIVTGLAFANPALILPMAVITLLVIAGFGIPAIWTRLAPEAPVKAMGWAKFQRDGIRTVTGHNTAGQATVQVLILPVLILVWGLAVVTIAAIVR